MKIEDVEAWIEANDFDSKNAMAFAMHIRGEKIAKTTGYEKISDDDIERMQLVTVLLSKLENIDQSRHISVQGQDWKSIGEIFSMLKFMLNDLKMNRIIDYLGFEMGGGAFFQVVDRQRYRDFLYDEVKSVIEKIKPKVTETSTDSAVETRLVIDDLESFKKAVERDGFIAFWTDSGVGKGLKNNPEEIARSQFTSFLAGEGIFDKGTHFREVPEGAGRTDVIRVEQGGKKRLFELKIISDEQNRFDIGLTQLYEYMCKEDMKESHYIIFEARHPSKRTTMESQYEKDGKKIFVTIIDIYQIAPTRKSA